MNNVFNKMQMFETSEVCSKFSKSVSYETLVGGTATTGTECGKAPEIEGVITRRTSVRRGYLPEQGTHANKESLFANVTWFMRLPRRIQRMLLVMTIPASCRKAHKRRFLFNLIRRSLEKFFKKNFRDDSSCFGFAKVVALALIFTIATTAESSATDVIPTSGTCNADGTCLWMLNDAGALTIYAKDGAKDVIMDDYYCLYNPCDQSTLIARPWENNLQQIKSVYIGDNITNIGDDAFQNASNLTSVTGMKDVKTIGDEGVFAYTGLKEITIPDGVTYIGLDAFNLIKNMKNVTLPDTINNIGTNTSPFIGNQAEINCLNTQGQCENLRELLGDSINGKTFNIISPTSNCASYSSRGCAACENTFYLSDGMCWNPWEKKRWTPAEAAKWLKDDNNTITITFKK